MNYVEMLKTALTSLRANKLRSALTMLGMLIGVASIIVIAAVGIGGRAAIVAALESARAADTIRILPRELVSQGVPQPGQALTFSTEDFDLVRQFSGVDSVSYTLYGQAGIASQGKTVNASVEGGPAYLNDLAHFTVIAGRMYDAGDVAAHRPVTVLSKSLATKLFGSTSPLGKTVDVEGHPLQVIGIVIPTQASLLSAVFGADYAYLPATTSSDLFPGWGITEMDISIEPGVGKAELAKRIVMVLNIHVHDPQAFEDSSGFLAGVEKTVGTVTTLLTLVVGAIAGIALVVGGVGVMNIMLVSVTERTREIGIRMSVGATRRDIMTQFLIESATITSLGGLLGIVLGVVVAVVVHWLTPIPATVSWQAIVISFVFSATIGIVCGLYPANKAARLSPIDALRYE